MKQNTALIRIMHKNAPEYVFFQADKKTQKFSAEVA